MNPTKPKKSFSSGEKLRLVVHTHAHKLHSLVGLQKKQIELT